MSEPERIFEFGRWHPGPNSRVEGIPGSANYGGMRGLILRRHTSNKALVLVQWDDADNRHQEYVTISLLRHEPVLDQLSRIMED